MAGWWQRLFARKAGVVRRPVTIRARYDAAQTSEENYRHWSASDGFGARTANSHQVRVTLRNRARYEVANNCYARGMVHTLAGDMVGTGPTLQLLTEDLNVNRQVEAAFGRWSRAVGLARKLRTAKTAKVVDGETFLLHTTNELLPDPVKLDVIPIECDQVAQPYVVREALLAPQTYLDGLVMDEAGNVVSYDVLSQHPGDAILWGMDYRRYPARLVRHWFRCDRPGQIRGVSELTPALPLFAFLRRYTLATVSAAEIAANFAGLLETEAPPDGTTNEPTPFETLEIERGMMTTLPSGSRLNQLKAEQPTTTYPDFKRELLKEIARCLGIPFILAAQDSSLSNYSSGRMDALPYRDLVRTERDECEAVVLDPILMAWLDEAANVPGLLPAGLDLADLPHAWVWPGWSYVDPQKEAAADTERLANGTVSFSELVRQRGRDPEDVLTERARDLEMFEEMGLPLPAWATGGQPAAPAPPTPTDTTDATDPEDAGDAADPADATETET